MFEYSRYAELLYKKKFVLTQSKVAGGTVHRGAFRQQH
jgi:hypothetical protein